MAVFHANSTYPTKIHKSGGNSTDLFTIDVIVPLSVCFFGDRQAYVLEDNHKHMERRVQGRLNRRGQLRVGHFDHSTGSAKAAKRMALVGRVPK